VGRSLVAAEVNAIGTAYQRTDLLPPESAAAVRIAMQQYVDALLESRRYGPGVTNFNGGHGRPRKYFQTWRRPNRSKWLIRNVVTSTSVQPNANPPCSTTRPNGLMFRSHQPGPSGPVVDLSYAGLFGLRNVPDEALQPFLLIEAPRLLFPFARQIVAEAVTNLGFPPLLLDPIDFASAYIAQAQAAQEQGAPAEGGDDGGGEPTPSDA